MEAMPSAVDNAKYWRGLFDGGYDPGSTTIGVGMYFFSLNNALMNIQCGQLQSKLMDVAMAVPALKQNSQLAKL